MDEVPEVWATRELEELRFPRRRRPTTEQMERYLEALGEGLSHYNAARAAGSTAARFRSMRRRDPSFDALATDLEQGKDEALQETIRGTLVEVALGHVYDPAVEAHPKQFEALVKLAETWLPEFEYRRNRRTTHAQDGPFEVLIGQKVDSQWLEGLSEPELEALETALRIVQGKDERGQLRSIEGGKP